MKSRKNINQEGKPNKNRIFLSYRFHSLVKLFQKPRKICDVLKFKVGAIFFFCVSFLILMIAGRAGLFYMASNYFSSVPDKQVLLSFFIGLRFDFYVISLFVFPWFILLGLPFTGKKLIKMIGTILCFLWLTLAILLLSDIFFFSFFNNHIGIEFFTAFTHLGLLTQLAFQTYWFIIFPLFFLLICVLWAFYRICNQTSYQKPNKFIGKSIALVAILCVVSFMGIRSNFNFHGKALGIANSQILGSQQTANLILNGAFTLLDAIKNNNYRKVFFTHGEDFFSVATQAELVLDPTNPFERARTHFNYKNNNYNFVILLLESFDPVLFTQHPEALPNLMKIKENSLYFENFYSVGKRSLIGVTGLLFSMPYVWGISTFTNGLGGKNLSRIAQYFNHKGYRTLNVITDRASSDKAKEMAYYAGFEEFYAKEDIPLHNKYPVFNKGFDYEGFEFLLSKINAIQGKFFAYMFTSSMHTPYNITLLEKYKKYPEDSEEHNFLNRVVYTDAGLGNFFMQAAKEPWFQNTIFLILPDHRAIMTNKQQENDKAKQNYRSFLLIYAPGLFVPKTMKINATQEDILPTLLDLLNSEEPFSGVGQSLFDRDRSKIRYIYSENKDIYILNEQEENTYFEFRDDISSLSDGEKKAVYLNEVIYQHLKNNTFKSQ